MAEIFRFCYRFLRFFSKTKRLSLLTLIFSAKQGEQEDEENKKKEERRKKREEKKKKKEEEEKKKLEKYESMDEMVCLFLNLAWFLMLKYHTCKSISSVTSLT